MDEIQHYHSPKFLKAREALTQALNEYMNVVNPEAAGCMGATVVYETIRFDDEGIQTYALQHVILDPSSLVHALGLLTAAKDRLSAYINRE